MMEERERPSGNKEINQPVLQVYKGDRQRWKDERKTGRGRRGHERKMDGCTSWGRKKKLEKKRPRVIKKAKKDRKDRRWK